MTTVNSHSASNTPRTALKILSETKQLSAVRNFVSEAAQRFGFDEDDVHNIALAVDEACTNIIKHAYGFVADQHIEIEIRVRETAFEVVISDCGVSFTPESIGIPDMKEYLSHFRRGGLGMHLMRSLMDTIEYRRTGENKNEVRMVKNLPAFRSA